jgi:hypothetical protein
VLIVFALVAGGSLAAVAQQSMDGPYVLHEYFEGGVDDGESGGVRPSEQPPPQVGPGLPPSLSLEARPGEPIYSESGPVFEEKIKRPNGELTPMGGSNELDDRTDRVDSLTYFSNFDPSVIPYKRVVAQNHVVLKPGGQYAVELRAGERRPVELSAAEGEMDTFWGTFLLRLEPGHLQPLASVAPDQRILQIDTEPDVAVEISRDAADNYYVRSRAGGLVRLNLHIAAPAYYFNGEFSPVAWDDFPADRVPPLDPSLRKHALEVARAAGFDRSQAPAALLLKMIRYFRNFDARPLPDALREVDRLEAIVSGQVGVCRHRSMAFVTIAQALGIPTRYVYNEAHAFVEIFWPGQGWRRVDLGGAADELNASAAEGRSVHDSGPDRLPTPERFVEEQQRMARNGWSEPGVDGSGGSENAAEEHGAAAEAEGQPGNDAATPVHENAAVGPNDAGEPVEASGDSQPSVAQQPPDQRQEARLVIEQATAIVRRGGQLDVAARLTDAAGRPIQGGAVEVYLGPVGATDPRSSTRLGTAQTNRDGRVRTRVEIPPEHAIGRWSLFVVFGGDEEYRPATAE